jgi:hypothetical protein
MADACPPLSIYSNKFVVVTIDGRRVIGLWEGEDAVQVERPDDLGSTTTGADGASVVSITASQTANVTLRLMANSAMNTYLQQRAKLMRAGSQRIMSVEIRDTITGEGGGCTSAIITKEPSKSYGATATMREWVIFCNCWQENDIAYNPAA